MHNRNPERTVFESASVVFGSIIAVFGTWGAVVTIAGGEGPGSGAFVISMAFVVLGLGRVVMGVRGRRRRIAER